MDQLALPLFGLVEIWGQRLEAKDLAVVGLLVVLEGVLSIDNALVLGLLAKRLPKHQRPRALSYGLIGAFVFRCIAVGTASWLLQWTFVKLLGGGYLVFIAVKHLFLESKEEIAEEIRVDEHGHPIIVEARTGAALTEAQERLEIEERVPIELGERGFQALRFFWWTVVVIELTDVAFAVDSILAAMALAGTNPAKLWVVITGGILGVVLMRFAAAIFIRLLDRFPRFEVAAYLLVIVIGLKLLADWSFNSDWSFDRSQWLATRLGGWKQSFERFEVGRRETVKHYEDWLRDHWIFGLHAPHAAEPGATHVPHVPHLLDFHDLRRPECLTFWLLMVVCFSVGFMRPPTCTDSA